MMQAPSARTALQQRAYARALLSTEPTIIRRPHDLPDECRPKCDVPMGNATCTSHSDTFKWSSRALDELTAKKMMSPVMLASACAGRTVTLSSSFSGVGFFDVAASMLERNVNTYLHCHADVGEKRFQVKGLSFCEKNSKCRAELLQPHCHYADAACIYQDILELLPPRYRRLLDMAETDAEQRDVVRDAAPHFNKKLFCVRHRKFCEYLAADAHSGGSPCTDHSSYGTLNREDGLNNRLYLVWMTHRLCLEEGMIFHENVKGFGHEKMSRDLSSKYAAVHLVLDAKYFGTAVNRERLWSLFIHKRNIVTYMQQTIFTPAFFYTTIREGFFRKCEYTEMGLFFDTQGVVAEERWARDRPSVRARREEMLRGEDDFEDSLLSIRSALSRAERASLHHAMSAHKKGIVDCGQNFLHRSRISKNNRLPTLIKNTGIMFCYNHTVDTLCPCLGFASEQSCGFCFRGRRPVRGIEGLQTCTTHRIQCCTTCFDCSHADTLLTAKECLAAQGMPVSILHMMECGGVTSSFSDHVGAGPAGRTRSSMASQAGNGMLTMHAGAMLLPAILYTNSANQTILLRALNSGLYKNGILFPDEITPTHALEHLANLALITTQDVRSMLMHQGAPIHHGLDEHSASKRPRRALKDVDVDIRIEITPNVLAVSVAPVSTSSASGSGAASSASAEVCVATRKTPSPSQALHNM
jgi:site-specific DNA-cytosine methylase